MQAPALKCFNLNFEEQQDKHMLVRFAARVPAVSGGGDHRVAQRMEFSRKAFQKNVSILWRNPSLNDACCNWLQEQTSEEVQMKLQGHMLQALSTMGTLDDTFASDMILDYTMISRNALEQAVSQDTDLLRQIMQ